MMIKTATARKSRVLIAGALALMLSQGVGAEDRQAVKREPAVVKVSIPSQRIEIAEPPVTTASARTEIDTQIEALDEQMTRELEKTLKEIGLSRVELVIADEVATRG